MDSIFELIPLILIVLWTVLGAGGAKKKQEQQRRQQAEAQRRAREAREAQRAPAEARSEGGSFEVAPREAAPSPTSGTDSAADMVPDELWAILTGGAPRPGQPAPAPRESEASYEASDDEAATEGGWVTSPPWTDEPAAQHSIEGISYDDAATETAVARYEAADRTNETWTAGARRDAVPRPSAWKAGTLRDARAAGQTDEERHDAFHVRLSGLSKRARVSRRGSAAARANLSLQDLRGARRAIVLGEVIGPPKSLGS